jgi:hypothetical protein
MCCRGDPKKAHLWSKQNANAATVLRVALEIKRQNAEVTSPKHRMHLVMVKVLSALDVIVTGLLHGGF